MNARFISPLRFEDNGGLPFLLLEALKYVSDVFSGQQPLTIVVPAGFLTDLASVPRVLWNILPPVGKYDGAAVVHDFLYQRAPRIGDTLERVSRDQADAVLLEGMKALGVSAWQRWAIYTGVRVGGGAIWKQYRATDKVRGVAL